MNTCRVWLLLCLLTSAATIFCGCKYERYKSHAISVVNTDDRAFIENGRAFGAIRGITFELQDVENVVPSIDEITETDEDGVEYQLITLTIGTITLEFKDYSNDTGIEILSDGKVIGTANRGDRLNMKGSALSIDQKIEQSRIGT